MSRGFPKIRNGEAKEVCFNAIIMYSGPNPDRLSLLSLCYLSSAILANLAPLPCEFIFSEQSSCTRLPLDRSVARALEWKSALLLSSSRIIEALNRGPFVEFVRLVSPTHTSGVKTEEERVLLLRRKFSKSISCATKQPRSFCRCSMVQIFK